jgi:lipopolysaccharide/colanic/teichoic acid biosynthesis glycosyltransferase
MLRKWDDLPERIRIPEVRPYYDILDGKRTGIILKRVFDFVISLVMIILLAVPMLFIALLIKLDSPGPVFFRQERVTACGKVFRIHKFRTMVTDADKTGTAVTVSNDTRITDVGRRLRRVRMDEIPQLFDVLAGNMSFVGTRPEAVKYVEQYRPEYYATLLLPAGITSEASIRFKDEEKMLDSAGDVDTVYVEEILPQKMKWNLESVRNFSLLAELRTMVKTVMAVLR